MAVQKDESDVDQRLDQLQELVEEQGRIIADQKARLDVVEGSWVSRMLHTPEEQTKTSRRDLLKRAGVAAAAAIGGMAIIDQPALAATGGPFLLGMTNDANARTILVPTGGSFPSPLLKGVGAGVGVAIQGNGSGVNTAGTVGIGVLGQAAAGAWGVAGSAANTPDLAAIGSGRVFQLNLASGPPGFASYSQESVRDFEGVEWLSDGRGGWAPSQFGGKNIAVYSAVITTQKTFTGSNGAAWADMDPTLHLTIIPNFHCQAIVTVNADLWTFVAGVNQDIGVRATSSTAPPGVGLYPTTPLQPEAWKESGGPVGFSPNAAYLETVLPMRAHLTYDLYVVWKASKSTSGTIVAGAGPVAGRFSPTRLNVHLIADSHVNVGAAPVHPPAKKVYTKPKKK